MSASLNYYLINENTSYAHSHKKVLSFYFYHKRLSTQTFQPKEMKFEIMGEDISTGGIADSKFVISPECLRKGI